MEVRYSAVSGGILHLAHPPVGCTGILAFEIVEPDTCELSDDTRFILKSCASMLGHCRAGVAYTVLLHGYQEF